MDDPEILAIEAAYNSLRALDKDGRERAVRYLDRRFLEEATETGEQFGPWIEHKGGGRPHPPATVVYARFRDGREEGPGCSAFLNWLHYGEDDDVLAYREKVSG